MKKYPLWLLLLLLASLACSLTAQTATQATIEGGENSTGTPAPTTSPSASASPAKPSPAARKSEPLPSPTPTTWSREYVVTGEQVNLRACAGVQCASMATLKAGQVVTVTGAQTAPDGGIWSSVQTQPGITGWVNSKYLMEVEK